MHLLSKAASKRAVKTTKLLGVAITALAVSSFIVACGDEGGEDTLGTSTPRLSGSIPIDGSSTVFPVTEAVAEEFRKEQPNVQVTVGISGTGGGFTRFCRGETIISDASRPIKSSEADLCTAAGIQFIELPVVYDGLSVVVHPQNDWATCITVAELKKMWEPAAQGTVTRWNQVRASWPDQPIQLFGPGTDSGTFDYFTEAINGEAQKSRGDYTPSEDDNVLVQGVAGNRNALGYFGLAYLEENRGRIKGVQVDGGKGCIGPTAATVEDGSYSPLSRPLFIYVAKSAAERPEVKAFVDFYIANAAELGSDVGYVQFPANFYGLLEARWEAGKVGTMYSSSAAGKTLAQLLATP
jgi:phosphate transport system substrate-binding protein